VTVPPTPTNVIASLGDRLTNTQDREAYAALMCYLNRLPADDEFRRLAELLGLLSLVGQRIPDALTEFLLEFRLRADAEAEFCGQVNARLAKLPQEIAEGVDPAVVAKAMSESFRQQLATSGLQETAALLKAAVITLKTLSGELTNVIKPVAMMHSEETKTLLTTVHRMEEENARESSRTRAMRWILVCFALVVTFLLGEFSGEVSERWHMWKIGESAVQVERLDNGSHVSRVQ
jgi:hypothetical protein